MQSNVAMRFEFFLNNENQLAFRLATIIFFCFYLSDSDKSYMFIFIFKYQIS